MRTAITQHGNSPVLLCQPNAESTDSAESLGHLDLSEVCSRAIDTGYGVDGGEDARFPEVCLMTSATTLAVNSFVYTYV